PETAQIRPWAADLSCAGTAKGAAERKNGLVQAAGHGVGSRSPAACAGKTEQGEEGCDASHHEGTGDFSGAVRWRCRTVQFAAGDRQLGRPARLQGYSDTRLGRTAIRPRQGCLLQGLLRRGEGDLR